MSFFNHWSDALTPPSTHTQPHTNSADGSPPVANKFKKLSVHRFGNRISIYAQDPSGQIKVYYRDIPHE